jgi:hypothetical protein
MESAMAIDATAAAAAKEVAAAENAIRALASADQDRSWSAYELKTQARNGWSASAMSVALNRLVDDGILELTDGDRVRLSR